MNNAHDDANDQRQISYATMDSNEILTTGKLHLAATNLADECQRRSHKKFVDESKDIVRGVLFAILHDAVIVHRGIGNLVEDGWSSAAAPLARTMLDLSVSMVAIVQSKNPPLAAFRYQNQWPYLHST